MTQSSGKSVEKMPVYLVKASFYINMEHLEQNGVEIPLLLWYTVIGPVDRDLFL